MQVDQNEHYSPDITMSVTEALDLIHRLTAAVISARSHTDGQVHFHATEIGGLDDEDYFDYTLVVKALI
jgi:hypothetical protein